MNATEEAADNAQYNASVAQFATGHSVAKDSISNMVTINTTQQQQIAALQMQVPKSANTAGQVIYCPSIQQPKMQMQMPMQQQQ
jgi:hypothetical protein